MNRRGRLLGLLLAVAWLWICYSALPVRADEPERLAFRVGKVVSMDKDNTVINNDCDPSLIPTAEKFSTIASVLTPGGYPWTDIYQAYHRLLLHHEHTDGANAAYTAAAAGARPRTVSTVIPKASTIWPTPPSRWSR